MIEELAKDMTAVLMKEGQLVLPGIGLFSLQTQPATISMIQGQAKPASKRAAFNPNLLLDDGRLIRYWMQQKGWSLEKAQFRMQSNCQTLLSQLNAGESALLPGFGRLFRDLNGELKFTPSEQNLEVATFGLPTVPIAAVVRTERTAATSTSSAAATPVVVAEPVSSLPSRTTASSAAPWADAYGFLQQYVWHIAAATLLLFVLSTWYLSGRNRQDTSSQREVASRTSSLPESETSPRYSDSAPIPPPSADDAGSETYPTDEPAQSWEINTSDSPTAAVTPREVPAAAPSSNFAVIAVGRYGKKENVDKMISRIEAAGYVAYSRQESGLTRVGVRYAYKSEGELDEVLNDVRRRFSQDAFILSRHKND